MTVERARASEPPPQRPERARLFVALELAPGARDELVRWREAALLGVTGLRAVDPAALHATLCFLGSRPVTEIEAIAAVLDSVAEGQVVLSLGEAVWLPRRRPRVLAVELQDPDRDQPLMRLQCKLSTALDAGGLYEPPARPYLAHVTVARVASSARVRATPLPPPVPVRFDATRVTLYRSHLGHPQTRYEPLASVRLRMD